MNRIIIILLVFALFSCKKDGARTVIKGKLEIGKNKYLYLQELTADNTGNIDSVLLEQSGDFKFVKKINNPTFFNLWTGKQKPVILTAMPGEKIKVTGVADSLFRTYEVTGSEESRRIQTIDLMCARALRKLDSLNRVFVQFKDNPNIVQIHQTLSFNFNQVIEEHREFTIMFLEREPSSVSNIYALYQKYDTDNDLYFLYKEEDFKYFDRTDSLLYRKYPKASYVAAFHEHVNLLRTRQQQLKLQRVMSAMGSQAPEIALPGTKGDTLRLSSFKGNYVLLSFWASWNPESKADNINLVEIYKRFHPKGFQIFQVSLDKTKENWVKSIRDNKLDWNHVCDFKFWDSPAVKTYNIESLPTTFLIDKDGFIVGRGLQGSALEERLETIYKE